MNLEKVIFGFFIILACSLNFGFFIGDIGRPELHHPIELFFAIVVNLIALVLKFGDRTHIGATHLATSLVACLQLIAAALAWTWVVYVRDGARRRQHRHDRVAGGRRAAGQPDLGDPADRRDAAPEPLSAATREPAAAMGDVLFLVLRRLRAPLITLIAVYSIAVVGLVAVPGETPDGQPWRMGFFHAFYVMSYTATTIGFGEIPYPFTDAQRLWVTFSIYLSVVGWAYAIGSVFALSQDATFRSAASRAVFLRRVAGLREPYCVICGYGRSGRAIARALDAQGARTVVVDLDPARVAGIAIEDFDASPLVLVADARHPDVLRDAGIARPECRAVLALTADDEANQSVAIGTRVLDPATIVIARVTDPAVKSICATSAA